MKYYVYILYSYTFDRYYVGQTNNLKSRLERHNNGYVKSTKPYLPWIIAYSEEYNTRSDAIYREYQIKKKKSRKYIQQLVDASR